MKYSRTALIFIVLAILSAAFGISFMFSTRDPEFEVVDQAYVKKHTGSPGFILLDTREADVYNGKSPFEGVPGGHIPGAINFPGSQLKLPGAAVALAKSGLTKNATIIIYCNAGRISLQYGEVLVKDFHFNDDMIKHYKGGVIDWSQNPLNNLEPRDHDK